MVRYNNWIVSEYKKQPMSKENFGKTFTKPGELLLKTT